VIKIPFGALSEQALVGVIDDFIHREGTDYGHRDYTREEKRRTVRDALLCGRATIVYDETTSTTTLLLIRD
jgi:uncharacterized protein